MRNSKKYPKTWAAFEKAKEVKTGLMNIRNNFMTELETVRGDRDRLTKQMIHLHTLANRNLPEIHKVSKEISALAKEMGGIVMKADPTGG